MTTVTSSTTNGITSFSGSAASLADTSNGVSEQKLGQADFLNLFTAQLQYQDPLNPLTNGDLVAQLATISNTSGISEINASLKSIQSSLSGSRIGDAANWIGRSILVTSNIAAPNAQGEYAGQFTLDTDQSSVGVDLIDGNGQVVRSLDLGAQKAGDVPFYWDGTDGNGNYIGGQALQVKIRGAIPNGVATYASVAAVQSPADGTASKLITPLGTFTPDQALRLS